ncbi:MAG: cadherin repeat domain-containing protein, partial [Pseudomonadota bacterium]
MAIFRVTNTNDRGPGSLRQAVRDANALAGADQIVFDPTVFSSENTTISLSLLSNAIEITDSLSINGDVDGDGDADVTLDGGGSLYVFLAANNFDRILGSARNVSFDNLNFTKGLALNVGGGIGSFGSNLTISNVGFSNNPAGSQGIGLFMQGGSAFVENSTFSGYSAQAGGSIINVNGALTLANVIFDNNSTPAPGDIGGGGTVIQAPYIASNGGGATAAISVAENTTAVTDVQVIDAVNSEGSGVTYSLSTGNSAPSDNSLFTIDPVNGLLSFIAAPDFEAPRDTGGNNVYNVQVVATNAAGVSDVQDIAVTVTDVFDPATFRVTNTNNSGAGSLRQAVSDANARPGADQIVFDPTVFSGENTTISLSLLSGSINITDSLSINGDVDGDGDADVTLDG